VEDDDSPCEEPLETCARFVGHVPPTDGIHPGAGRLMRTRTLGCPSGPHPRAARWHLGGPSQVAGPATTPATHDAEEAYRVGTPSRELCPRSPPASGQRERHR